MEAGQKKAKCPKCGYLCRALPDEPLECGCGWSELDEEDRRNNNNKRGTTT
jgi:hypothetical protein